MKPILFAVQHKCGNMFLTDAIKKFIESNNNLKFEIKKKANSPNLSRAEFHDNTIYRLCNYSYDDIKLLAQELPVIVIVRDPRALVISCSDYHSRGPERWTLVPQKKYDGLSYAEYLQQADSDVDMHIRSIKNMAGEIIERLQTFANKEDIHIVTLDNLSWDSSLLTYQAIASYLNLPEHFREPFIEAFASQSLWKIKSETGKLKNHSTSGVSKKAKDRLNGKAKELYDEKYSNLHEKFGYS